MRGLRQGLLVSFGVLAVACVGPLPEGQYACVVAETDCPSGWSCLAGRCYSQAPVLGADAGPTVLGAADGGATVDAAMSVESPDAALAPPSDSGAAMADAALGSTPDAAPPADAAMPVEVAHGALAVGGRHACHAALDGAVSCWGDDATGALGVPASQVSVGRPALVPGVSAARDLCAGTGFSCALDAAGQVRCWGQNDRWQLGRDATSPAAPGPVDTIPSASAIACGGAHACAVTTAGIWCWGANAAAQTASAASTRERPHLALAGTFVSVALGDVHGCALSSLGVVSCWGSGAMGQLGPRGGASSSTAVVVPDVTAQALSAGAEHSCALTTDGAVACWGRADDGRLGTVGTGAHATPVIVGGAHQTVALASGSQLNCAASADPAMPLGCWGSLAYGQLGVGGALRTGVVTTPAPVVGVAGEVHAIAAGTGFGCAAAGADVYCWGLNDRGQVGDGTTTSRSAPVRVAL
ncbi:MAG: hypothetical protein U0234_03585 [Sandaracinus sp.]